jgi:MazG family protein
MQDKTTLEDTLALMRDLRRRCDWDAVQTHQSLRPYLIEESQEVDEALHTRDDRLLRDELGDLLLQILFHSVIAEERGAFDLFDVAHALVTKMKGRHPHLYGDGVKEPWERMKAKRRTSIVDGLPLGLPPLHRAYRLQERAAGVGFDWPDITGPIAKVEEELSEVRSELDTGAPTDRVQAELGDLLFACVNLCRKAGVHPALALEQSNDTFVQRFRSLEALAKQRGIPLGEAPLETLDSLWDEVKAAAP